MTNSNYCWSVYGLILFLLVICLAEPLQGSSVYGLQGRILNTETFEAAGIKTLNEGREHEANEPDPENHSTAVLLGHAQAYRRRRNIVDDAKETVKSTTEKLYWVKKNFRYLLLMFGSIFFLFFSCAVYRRLTRDKDDGDGDEVTVVVMGGPKEKSPATGTLPSPPITTKGTNMAVNSNKTNKSSKPSTEATKKNKNAKSTRMKGKRKREDPKQGIKESESNDNRNDYSDSNYDSSDSDVILGDFMNACAEAENGHTMIKRNKANLFDALLKKPFPQIKIDACVINEGIPLSSYTSFQQIHQSEAELKVCEPTTQYVDEIRERAEILYGKRQVTKSTTSYSQYPVLDDLELDKRFGASILERCCHYHPKASTYTCLPITAAAK